MEKSHSVKLLAEKIRKSRNPEDQWLNLKACSLMKPARPAELLEYHDVLLFLCAYPLSEKIHTQASTELHKIEKLLRQKKKNQAWQYALSGSGLPHTEIRTQFSADMTSRLMHTCKGDILPVEASPDREFNQRIWQALLPTTEFHETTRGNMHTWKRIQMLTGHWRDTFSLQWLLDLLDRQELNPLLKDLLYDQLKIFSSWKLEEISRTRSFCRIAVKKISYNPISGHGISSKDIVLEPLKKPIAVDIKDKNNLIATAGISLALLSRETDPVTYADEKETELFDCGKGLQVLLTGMTIDRRLSIESYVGFMAFLNGVPIAYGGGWIFGKRCKIGVNIFPAFRGGSSMELFCQVMRVYQNYFRIKIFLVKPYQFGKDNPDGIKSGAYWFYHKIGFRSLDQDIRALAEKEWQKIQSEKGYRTSPKTLKKFTSAYIFWVPGKQATSFYDADAISEAVTRMIIEKFDSNRNLAIKACFEELLHFTGIKSRKLINKPELHVYRSWALILGLIKEKEKWNASERNKFRKFLEVRASGSERESVLMLQGIRRFWLGLNEFSSQQIQKQ